MECYKQYTSDAKESCLKQCEGTYAVVQVNKTNKTLALDEKVGNEEYKNFVMEYLQYKRAYEARFGYFFEDISGRPNWPFVNEQAVLATIDKFDVYLQKWEKVVVDVQQRLEIVKLYFETPTFDLVTKDARTDFVTKISLIGGMLGLFTGFSFVSGIEIIYFILKFVIRIYRK